MNSSMKPEKQSLMDDNPAKKDALGFDAYVEILEASILATESLPFTIGIFGDWGTGKTTLMNLLENKFKEKNGYKTIWINPWKYDTREDVRKVLIASILTQLKVIYKKETKLISTLLREIAWTAADKGTSYITAGLLSGTIERVRDKLTSDKETELEFYNLFETKFKELINTLVGEEGRLVIFIDDLDRCLPENAVTILESLKLFLNEPHCIFILGMDRKIIEHAIEIRYERVKEEFSGLDYLDKIVQLPFFIPPIQYEKLRTYLKESTKLVSGYDANIWSLIDHGFGGNPRKVKRFVNCYYLLKKALETRTITEKYSGGFNAYDKNDKLFFLAKILIIRMRYPAFYDFLVSDNEALGYYDEAIQECIIPVGSDSGSPPTFKFINQAHKVLEEHPELKPYWEMEGLRKFLINTRYGVGFPETPSPDIIKYLLLLTGFIEGETITFDPKKMSKVKLNKISSTHSETISGATSYQSTATDSLGKTKKY